MSSINQLVSQLAHNIKQADSVPVRNALKLSIIQVRNKLIRQSYEQHGYADKGLHQRIKLSLIDIPDGDITELKGRVNNIKRTKMKVPKPTRFINNTPFQSVRTVGVKNPIEIAFVKEASAKFYGSLPGMCNNITYDYINGYIYVNTTLDDVINNMEYIIVESVFEQPQMISEETVEGIKHEHGREDDDEFLIPEDIIPELMKIVMDTFNPNVIRQTNEIPTGTKVM